MYKEDYDSTGYQDRSSEDVFSKQVRAGKRTYFFDVKATRGEKDFYLTITESRRRNTADGSAAYDKHKIFLYKEDFRKFQQGLSDILEYMRTECFGGQIPEYTPEKGNEAQAERNA
ncbi:MAG: DUF3276 family protein [Bacteroidales bacterium]|nr:DUF3276 family protein [Bacteroidales bacterium]